MIPLKTVKRHLNIYHDRDDTLLDIYLAAAISACERYAQRTFKKRSIVETFDGFGCINNQLSMPLQSVEEIRYVDKDSQSTIVDPSVYHVTTGLHGGVYVHKDQTWPVTREQYAAVVVEYTSGYDDDTLPRDLLIAIMAMTGQLYEVREPVAAVQLYEVPMSFKFLISPFCKGVM